jgi:hypothetical protein
MLSRDPSRRVRGNEQTLERLDAHARPHASVSDGDDLRDVDWREGREGSRCYRGRQCFAAYEHAREAGEPVARSRAQPEDGGAFGQAQPSVGSKVLLEAGLVVSRVSENLTKPAELGHFRGRAALSHLMLPI